MASLDERIKLLEKRLLQIQTDLERARKQHAENEVIWINRNDIHLTAKDIEDGYLLNIIDMLVALRSKYRFLPKLKAEAEKRGLL